MNKFDTKYRVDKKTGCWNWLKPNSIGYGQFKINGRNIGAHRVSWIIHNGDIPEGLNVLHKCDNRRCVNPDHLFIGTQQDNVDDMIEKGRKNYFCNPPIMSGENNPRARLNFKQVKEIRKLYKERVSSGKGSIKKIADRFNISYTTAHSIITRKTWKGL